MDLSFRNSQKVQKHFERNSATIRTLRTRPEQQTVNQQENYNNEMEKIMLLREKFYLESFIRLQKNFKSMRAMWIGNSSTALALTTFQWDSIFW